MSELYLSPKITIILIKNLFLSLCRPKNKKAQTEIQEDILEFLCPKEGKTGLGLYYKNEKNQIVAGDVKLVRFVKGEPEENNKEIQIEISKLLSCKSCSMK